MPDTAYNITRRGQRVTVSLQGSQTTNNETLERSESRVVSNHRFVKVEPTKYSRLVAAKNVARDVGETTFIFWLKDVTFRRLTPEDYAIVDGKRYNFVESTIEDTGLVATAREITGQIPYQQITLAAADDLGFEDTASDSVT